MRFLISLLFILFFLPVFVQAQIFYLQELPTEEYQIKSRVGVFINTKNQTVNAFSGKINIPPDCNFSKIESGNSTAPLWVEEPKYLEGKIIFSGVIPGGLASPSGLLFSFLIFSSENCNGKIFLDSPEIYLHDGQGTKIIPPVVSLDVPAFGLISLQAVADTDPPADFSPLISRSQNIFDGSWFVSFLTQDKGSGIDYYEIYESKVKQNLTDVDDWIRASSPFLLKDQSRRSYIYVKAVDKNGNERVVEIIPDSNKRGWGEWAKWVIISLVIIFALFFAIYGVIKFKKSVFISGKK